MDQQQAPPYGPVNPQMYYQPPYPPQQRKSSSTTWIVLMVILGAVLLGLAAFCSIAMKDMPTYNAAGKGQVTVLSEGVNEGKVMVIPIQGVIGMADMMTHSGVTVEGVKQYLDLVEEDDRYRAILLDIDSPGGSVYVSDEVYDLLRRKGEEMPVYAHFRSMAASGGYYVGCSAEKIYADPTCLTGSIGVIVQTMNFEGLMSKIGVSVETLKSSDIKDILSPYRPMRDEERAIMQSIVDEYYDLFAGIVTKSREIPAETLRNDIQARIYTANQALEVGLIDMIAREEEVYADIRNIHGDVSFVTWERLPGLLDLLAGYSAEGDLDKMLQAFSRQNAPQFMYLWNGGTMPGEAVFAPFIR
jgi:protease-4